VRDLFKKRLLFVTGKGGVGKTTVAAALGLAAARAGHRTIVVEVAEQEHIAATFGVPAVGAREREVAPGLHAFSVDPEAAKEEWLRRQLKSGVVANALNQSRIFSYLSAAAPGLAELVTIGKVWELAQLERIDPSGTPYDLVIVDAPATGHGMALLRAPKTFGEIARVGPINRHAQKIDAFIRDPGLTGVVGVALPEEMPVNETIEIEQRLRDELSIGFAAVLVNAVLPEHFSAAEAETLASVDGGAGKDVAAAIGAALTAHEQSHAQREQVARLRAGLDARVLTLPNLLVPEVELADLERLAAELDVAA
jgi:anion-transporting  ArsA/GET3 family ATPase